MRYCYQGMWTGPLISEVCYLLRRWQKKLPWLKIFPLILLIVPSTKSVFIFQLILSEFFSISFFLFDSSSLSLQNRITNVIFLFRLKYYLKHAFITFRKSLAYFFRNFEIVAIPFSKSLEIRSAFLPNRN